MRLSRAMLLALVAMICLNADVRGEWWSPAASVKKMFSGSSTNAPSTARAPEHTASSTNSRTPTAPRESNLTFAPAPGAPQPSVTIPAATSPAGPAASNAPKPRTWSSRMRSAATATRNALTIKPREIPADDPVRLSSNQVAPQPAVFVSAARVSESQGRFEQAREQYDKALKANPQHVDALVGLARLQHREGDLVAATELYQRALRTHPDNAVVLNDLGLCYARRGMLEQARQSMEHAVKQDPKSKLYRNNLAVVFVEVNDAEAALQHLRFVHGEAIAHYNLGYMLSEKGQQAAAVHHLQTALAIDPRMEPARQMLAQFEPRPAPAAAPQFGPPQMQPQYRQPEVPQQRDYPVNYRQAEPQGNYAPASGGLPPSSGQPRAPLDYDPAIQGYVPSQGGGAHISLRDQQPAPNSQSAQPPANPHRPTVNYVQPPMNDAQPPANYVFPPATNAAPPVEPQPAHAAPLPGELPDYLRGEEQQPQSQPSRSASRWSE